MRALVLIADRQMELRELTPPAPPGDGEVQVRVKVMALNHIDVWGYRGMAFVRRKFLLVVGAEAAGEVAAVGVGVTAFAAGDAVVMYGALDLRPLSRMSTRAREFVRERTGSFWL